MLISTRMVPCNLIVALALTSGGCSEGRACEEFPLTHEIVAADEVLDWEPLGLVNGLSHVFPTDHQYLRVADPEGMGDQSREVRAPGEVDLLEVSWIERATGTEYNLRIEVCGAISIELAHMQSFEAALLDSFSGSERCETYDPGDGPITECFRRGRVSVAAGTLLGTVGASHAPYLDVSAFDDRHENDFLTERDVPYPRAHAVSVLDLFTPEIRVLYASKVGRHGTPRTALPLGGTLEVDVVGSAQGHWYAPARAAMEESWHFALVPDYIEPETVGAVSIGATLAPAGGYIQFTFETDGTRNRDPSTLTDSATTYCFDDGSNAALVQLIDAESLRAEYFAGETCGAAMAFTPEASLFER